MKFTAGFFEFSCCEGCQLQLVNLEEDLLEVADRFEILEWREGSSFRDTDSFLDIAVIEGSILTADEQTRLRKIRDRSGILIALGACATIGGINKIKDNFTLDDIQEYVHGKCAHMPHLQVTASKALDEIVKVDYRIHGCPIHRDEFVYFLKCILAGITPEVPSYPVCVECKANENMCLWDIGVVCLGPIIRAGCGARCPTKRFRCFGCRGYMDEPNVFAAHDVMRIRDYNQDELKAKMLLFGSGHKPTYE